MPDLKKALGLVESIIAHAEDERTNRSWESDDIGWKNIDKIWDCSQQLKELLKEQEALLNKAYELLADMGLDFFCDDLMCDDGWCDEHCTTNGPMPECIERWFRKQISEGR